MIKTYKGYEVRYAKAKEKYRARLYTSGGLFTGIGHYGNTKTEAVAACIEILNKRLGLTKPLEVKP